MQLVHIRFLSLSLVLALIGCGGGGSNSMAPPAPTPSQPQSSSSTVGVSIGDAPADWIMAFGMTINSITMTSSGGQTVNLLSSPTTMEMTQLMGTLRLLSIPSLPQGTYTQATITLSAMSLGYMDPNTHQYIEKTVAGPVSGTMSFNPGLVVGNQTSIFGFDMDMADSVSIDGSGTVTITPHFSGSMNPVSTGSHNPWDGWMQHMVGSVASTSGSQFTMNMMMGLQNVTFTTDSNTQFNGMGGMGMMGQGMIVDVDATLQPDGSLLAQRIASLQGNSGGMMGSGILRGITGNPPSQVMMSADDGIGGGMMMSAIANSIAVNLSGSTPCSFDRDGVDLTNLPFTPALDCSTMALGQNIQVMSGSSMMGGGMGGGMMGGGPFGTINASQIMLEQQALRGTVSNYAVNGSQASFTLSLSPDSAFALLTGTTSVSVYQQAGTQMHGTSAVANGQELECRGLMFYDSGTYRLVATWLVP
jgi:Domain of unknown function (DUF5666)/Domain of unknown function (DUF4382)